MVFHPSYSFFVDEEEHFKSKEDWKVLLYYGDVKETIPPNVPEAHGSKVLIKHYVDPDHAGEKLTCRSRG